MTIEPIALARQLIDIPSTTENEHDLAVFLDEQLTRLGYKTRRNEVNETRFNLYASTVERPRIVINSHIDTVPPWFASREDDEFIYGRGACDTKGIIAAMIAAGETLRERGVNDFAYLFVVGEETDSIGAKTANVAFKDLGSEFVLVGEPTESQFARASKGALTAFVRFYGIAGHSAYPEHGDSAINKLANAIGAINATNFGEDPVLGKATANVGVVRGGEKPNVIAGSAECELILRLVGEPDDALKQLEALVAKFGGTITLSRGNPPQHMIVPDNAPSTVVSFNTDVPWLPNLGKPLLFGPGSILDAHGVNEKIGKRELMEAVETYAKTIAALLGS